MKTTYFIYGLMCPIEYTIKYVGCSKNPYSRTINSLNSSWVENKQKREWTDYLKSLELKPIIVLLDYTLSEEGAKRKEHLHIEKHRKTIFNSERKILYNDWQNH